MSMDMTIFMQNAFEYELRRETQLIPEQSIRELSVLFYY